MCFNGWMSGGFAVFGLALSIWVDKKLKNRRLAIGVFYFFLMEALQAVQYLFVASGLGSPVCETLVNKVLTVAGFLHICFQPFFCHLLNDAVTPPPTSLSEQRNQKLRTYHDQFAVVMRLCVIMGLLMFIRWPLSYIPGWNTLTGMSTEWLRGNELCTFKSQTMWHLGWSIPMADATYNIPGVGIHCFMMFAPFFAFPKKVMYLHGIFLYLTGPFTAAVITSNLMEQASIWCFLSIAQITLMLSLVRKSVSTSAAPPSKGDSKTSRKKIA